MTDRVDVRETGERIEALLADLRSGGDHRTAAAAEELVRSMMSLYGAGLERVLELLPDRADLLAADPLVETLLLLHGLHPLDVSERIERALNQVRPYLGSHLGGIELLEVDAEGVARLRLLGSCDGCASSTRTVELAIQGAIEAAAPEVTGIDVQGVARPRGGPLLQVGRRPPDTPADPSGWALVTGPRPAHGGLRSTEVGGERVVLCDLDGTLFAYLDTCPACAGALSTGGLTGDVLTCAGCGIGYDVRRAGTALEPTGDGSAGRHLEPVPLTVAEDGVRLALAGART